MMGGAQQEFNSRLAFYQNHIYVAFETLSNITGQGLGSNDIAVSKVSIADRSVLWTRQYGSKSFDFQADIAISNEGFIAVCFSFSPSNGVDIRVFGINPLNGNTIWTVDMSGPGNDMFPNLKYASNGLLYMHGATAGYPVYSGPQLQRSLILSIASCSDGVICSNDGSNTTCPAGFYCSLGSKFVCPLNYYCPSGSSVPVSCPDVFTCPVGSASTISKTNKKQKQHNKNKYKNKKHQI